CPSRHGCDCCKTLAERIRFLPRGGGRNRAAVRSAWAQPESFSPRRAKLETPCPALSGPRNYLYRHDGRGSPLSRIQDPVMRDRTEEDHSKLAVFPAFHKVEGRRVVIVGGGDEAAAKVRLLAETGAAIEVVAADPAPAL